MTVNFPPDLFRQLEQWARDAADANGVPRVGVQEAVRAMVRVIATGQARNAENHVLAEVRQEQERKREEYRRARGAV